MSPGSELGRILIIGGAVLIAAGLMFLYGGKIGWLGHLPGDLHFRGRNFSFYFPLASSLLISLILSLLFWIFSRK